MKILRVAGTIMLHLERDEAIHVANILDPSNSDALRKLARSKADPLFAEIVRQIDICLNAEGGTRDD